MALCEGVGLEAAGRSQPVLRVPLAEKAVSQEQPEKLGRYEITGFLGKGAMGVVYEGRDPNIGRRVAIKTARRDVLEGSGQADEMMERFLREARAAGSLNHPNIVTVYDADEQDGTAYIAMEFIEGSDLQKAIEQKRRYSPEEVVGICATICDALHHAHEHGVVHRDVKPANIMLLPDNTLRVTDFGIARIADSTLTIDGAMIGTPHYMSPEQFMGQRVDGRSDLFSVGVIAYVLLTGERPFPGDALATVMHAVTQMPPIAPVELNFSISPTLNAVVLKSLSKNPNQRYGTAGEMAAALRESLKENPDSSVTMISEPAAASVADTVPGTAAFDAEKTVPMTDPPRRVDTSDVTHADGTAAPPASTANRSPLYAAVAVVAVLAIAGLVMFTGGGDDGAGAGASANHADADTAAPDAAHYFSAVDVHAFLAPNEAYYVENDGRLLIAEDRFKLTPATAEVVVRYPDGAERSLGVLPENIEDVEPFRLEGRPSRFTLILRQEGYAETTMELRDPARANERVEFMVGAGAGKEPVLLLPIGNES